MFKSKIGILTIFLVLLMSSVCFADARWLIVEQGNNASIALDTTRISMYQNAKNTYLDCWTKMKFISKEVTNVTMLEHTYVNIKTLNYKVSEKVIYEDDKYVGTKDTSESGWESPIPGSRTEEALLHSIQWVNNNRDKVTMR